MGLLPDVAHCTACGEALTAGETRFNTLGDGLFCAVHRESGTRARFRQTAGNWRSGCCVRRWRLLRRSRGRGGAGRICGGLRCKRWSGIWSGSCRRRRRWHGLAGDHGGTDKIDLSPDERELPVSSTELAPAPETFCAYLSGTAVPPAEFSGRSAGACCNSRMTWKWARAPWRRRRFCACWGPSHYKVGYAQPSRRPADGRYGENPNRLFRHTQFQLILKPPPVNVQELYLESLEAIGIDLEQARFEV